jgi:dienelactone hydrolase
MYTFVGDNRNAMRKLILSLVLTLIATSLMAQDVKVATYTFAHRGERELKLNIYSTNESVEPCLIYIFGGAFVVGSREEPSVIEVYEYFARRGWKVIAIDYRLGLKPLIDEPDVKRSIFDFRSMLIDAIDMAAEDLIEATAFVVSNAEVLGVDPAKIVTLGSSAGAITALQAEWAICNEKPMTALLPAGFNYSGVVAMAGAICSPTRTLEWRHSPCPLMLFHGTADANVPYGRQSLFGVSLHGSEAIAESLEESGSPYWFYDVVNIDHNFSWRPMYFLRPEIELFAERMAFGGQRLQIHQRVDDTSLPELESEFSILDYIKNNFAPNKPRGVDAAVY